MSAPTHVTVPAVVVRAALAWLTEHDYPGTHSPLDEVIDKDALAKAIDEADAPQGEQTLEGCFKCHIPFPADELDHHVACCGGGA